MPRRDHTANDDRHDVGYVDHPASVPARCTLDPTQLVQLGRSPVFVSRLGLGMATLGNASRATDEDAQAVIARAQALGLRHIDTAAIYGLGLAERRLGLAMAGLANDMVISTKVGRLLRPATRAYRIRHTIVESVSSRAGVMVLGRKLGRTGRRLLAKVTSRSTSPTAAGTGVAAPTTDLRHRPAAICAYSYDGVMRSFEESLGRLRMDRVPLVFIHDPDLHYGEASRGAYRALEQLRAAGSIDAIGVGMSDPEALVRFADSGDYDCFLLGGRYTLLEQPALEQLLPLAVERGISILLGGPFNSGVLANPAPGALYDHAAASDSRIDTARRIKAVCDRQGIPVAAAALQFPLAHPAIVSVLVGAGSLTELDEDDALMRQPIPSALWDELRHEGLLRADAPTPS